MLACLTLAMTFAELLLNFFEHEIDRCIKIALDIFGDTPDAPQAATSR